jgi:hypothetical protein
VTTFAVVYDAGALVAAERSDRMMWAIHRAYLTASVIPVVPAPVVAQVSRSAKQVQLHRLLAGCEIVPFQARDAHEVGRLLAKAKRSDVVDAAVVCLALARRAEIVTGDPDDLAALVACAPSRLPLVVL